MKTTMTVGDLRKALDGLDAALPVWIEAEAFVDGDVDMLHAAGMSAGVAEAGKGGILDGPPVKRFVIYADGVPEGTCRDCGRDDGTHAKYCEEAEDEEGLPEDEEEG